MEYICYCDRVTEEDIIRAMENGARSLKEIKAATGAMSHCDCANKNPKGTWCSADIMRVGRENLARFL